VLRNITDLEQAYLKGNASYNRTAVWHDSYANRIEKLPRDGVHPALIDFASAATVKLHALAESLRGTEVEVKNLENQITSRTEYRYAPKTGFEWWWGPARTAGGYVMTPENTDVTVHSNLAQVRQAQQQTVQASAAQRQQIWAAMAQDRDQTQQKMVQEFGREFLRD
jgi:hypothetical protein